MSKKKRTQRSEATVWYICDRMACQPCDHDDIDCSHTLDISHAKNFKQVRPGLYVEHESENPIFLQAENLSNSDDLRSLHQSLVDMKDSGIVVLPKQVRFTQGGSTQIGF